MGEADVGHEALAEEGRRAGVVRSTNWSGMTMWRGSYFSLSEPTAETERIRSTPSDFMAQMFARKGSSRRQEAMAAAVAGQEGDPPAFEGPDHEGVGGLAEGRVDRDLAHVLKPSICVEAAAPDDPEIRLVARHN